MLYRAQVAIEYMLGVAMVMVPLVLLTAYSYAVIRDYLGDYLLSVALETLATTADEVSVHDTNSFKEIEITLPAGYNYSGSYIGNESNGVGKTIKIAYKQSNAFRTLSADAFGQLQVSHGTTVYRVYKTKSGAVRIVPKQLCDIKRGLVAHWSFDNSTIEAVGGLDGIAVGNVNCSRNVYGAVSTACAFSGDGSYVQLPISVRDLSSPVANDITITVWYKPAELDQADNNEALFGGYHRHLFISVPGGYPVAYVHNSADQLFSVNSSVQMVPGNWYHISVVYWQNKTFAIYVNGVLQNTSTWSGDFSPATSTVRIGQRGTSYVNGTIDEVRLYSRALNSYEIGELYDAGCC